MSRVRSARSLGAALVALALLAQGASADQTSARDEPTVYGPLELVASGCGGGPVRHDGRVIARVASCVRLYQFDDVMETDPLTTYGVAWVQATVDAMRGWCTTRANTEILLPEGVPEHGRAPARRIAVRKTKPLRIRLPADADNYALVPAWVRQRVTAYKGVITPSSARDGRLLRLTWKGRQSKKLAFASGVEISWDYFSGPEVRGGLGRLSFVKSRSC